MFGRPSRQGWVGASVQGAHDRIVFDRPYLPKGIPQLWIKGLRSNNASVDLFFERKNDAVHVEVTDQEGDIEVVVGPSASGMSLRSPAGKASVP